MLRFGWSYLLCLLALAIYLALPFPVDSWEDSLVDVPEGYTTTFSRTLVMPDPSYDPWASHPGPNPPEAKVEQKTASANTWVEDSFADFIDGTFDDSGAKVYAAADGSLQVIHRRDLNRDGFIDSVVCNTDDGDSHYAIDSYIYWGTTHGLNPLLRTNIPGSGAIDAGVADFNNDGYVDLILTNWLNATGGHNIPSWIYWGTPTGYSITNRTNLPGQAHTGCAISDLNKDGWLDIAIAHFPKRSYNDDFLTIHWGSSIGFNTQTQLSTVGCVGVSIADLNKDGSLDIVVGAEEQTNGGGPLVDSYIFWGANGVYSNNNKTLLAPTTGAIETSIADLDKDGWLDLVFANHVNVPNMIFWGGSLGYTDGNRTEVPASESVGVSIDDLDDDGHLDLVFCNFNSQPSYLYFGNGTRNGWTQKTLAVPSLAFGSSIADYNNDGRLDISYSGYGFNTFPTYYGDGFRFQSPASSNLPNNGAHFNITADIGHVYDRRDFWTYVSSPFDAGQNASFNTLIWDEILPPGTDISFQIRTGNTLAELQAAPWLGPNGSDNYNTSPAFLNTIHQNARWIQYAVTLYTDQEKDSPILRRVEIGYSQGTPTPFTTTTPSNTPTPTLPKTPTPASTPVLVNGSFESNLTGWTQWIGAGGNSDPIEIDILGTGAFDGSKVLAVKGFGTGGKGAFQYVPNGWVNGRFYRIAVSTKTLWRINMKMSVGYFMGSGTAADAANATYGDETVHPANWSATYVDFLYTGASGVTIYLKATYDGDAERAGFDNVVILDFGISGSTPTPTPTVGIPPGVEPDFINILGGAIEPAMPAAGLTYWKLVDLKSYDPIEGQGKVNIFVKTLDESGAQLGGIAWRVFTAAGFQQDILSLSSGWSDYAMAGGNWLSACDYVNPPNLPPPYPLGPYHVRIMGANANWPELTDIVYGMGLPCNHHWSYELIFRRTLASPVSPTSTPGAPTSTFTPSPVSTLTRTPTATLTGSTNTPTRTPTVVPSFTPTPTPTATSAGCSISTWNNALDPSEVDSIIESSGGWGGAQTTVFASGVTQTGHNALQATQDYGASYWVWNFTGLTPNAPVTVTLDIHINCIGNSSWVEIFWAGGTRTAAQGKGVMGAYKAKWDSNGSGNGTSSNGWLTLGDSLTLADASGNFTVAVEFGHWAASPATVSQYFDNLSACNGAPAATNTPTFVATATRTNTPLNTSTPTLTQTPTRTFTPSSTATIAATATGTPTVTPTLPPATPAHVYVLPVSVQRRHVSPGALVPGATATIDIIIENVTNLGSYSLELAYGPTIVTITPATSVTQGSFLESTGRTVNSIGPHINNQTGLLTIGAGSSGAPAGPSGTGTLVHVNMMTRPVNQVLTSLLVLQNINLQDVLGNPILSTSANGTFTACYFADVDCNDRVDIIDIQIVAGRWNTLAGMPNYNSQSDLDLDGDVDILDVQRAAGRWNTFAPFPN